MAHAMHSARITGPVTYIDRDGARIDIPSGPCLLEVDNVDDSVDVIWGQTGEQCATLPLSAIVDAQERGELVLLDKAS